MFIPSIGQLLHFLRLLLRQVNNDLCQRRLIVIERLVLLATVFHFLRMDARLLCSVGRVILIISISPIFIVFGRLRTLRFSKFAVTDLKDVLFTLYSNNPPQCPWFQKALLLCLPSGIALKPG